MNRSDLSAFKCRQCNKYTVKWDRELRSGEFVKCEFCGTPNKLSWEGIFPLTLQEAERLALEQLRGKLRRSFPENEGSSLSHLIEVEERLRAHSENAVGSKTRSEKRARSKESVGKKDNETNRATMIEAARTGDSSKVRGLPEEGVSIVVADDHGNTALHAAAQSGRLEIVELLLGKGAPINERNLIGQTPFELAALNGHVEIVQYLAERGALSSYSTVGVSALEAAASNGHLQIVKYLIGHKYVNVNDRSGFFGSTPLHSAAGNGHLDIVRYLIGNGADVSARDNQGLTPAELVKLSLDLKGVQDKEDLKQVLKLLTKVAVKRRKVESPVQKKWWQFWK